MTSFVIVEGPVIIYYLDGGGGGSVGAFLAKDSNIELIPL